MKAVLWLAVLFFGVVAAAPATPQPAPGVNVPTPGQAGRVSFETLTLTDASA